MMQNQRQYQRYVRRLCPPSPLGRDIVFAFLIGGAICALGQLIANGWTALGFGKTDVATATSCSLIFLSALLTGLSWYDDLARIAGAGTLVPITGFANSVASPALEFRAEGMVTGLAVKMFSIAGPVLVYGVAASVLYGIVLVVIQLL